MAINAAHPGRVQAALRGQDTPIIARIDDDRVLLDVTAVFVEQDPALSEGLAQALAALEQP